MGRECVEGGVEDRGQVKLSMVLRRNRDPSFACFTTHNPKNWGGGGRQRLIKELFGSIWMLSLSKLLTKKSTTIEFEGELIQIQSFSACV